jgi:hypothetical protein
MTLFQRASTDSLAATALSELLVDSGGRAVDVGLQKCYCLDRGFESQWGHGCWSPVFVVCCVVCLATS